jgi:hypothetical protein
MARIGLRTSLVASIGDDREVRCALSDQGTKKVLGQSRGPKATDHDACSVRNIRNGVIKRIKDFVLHALPISS